MTDRPRKRPKTAREVLDRLAELQPAWLDPLGGDWPEDVREKHALLCAIHELCERIGRVAPEMQEPLVPLSAEQLLERDLRLLAWAKARRPRPAGEPRSGEELLAEWHERRARVKRQLSAELDAFTRHD